MTLYRIRLYLSETRERAGQRRREREKKRVIVSLSLGNTSADRNTTNIRRRRQTTGYGEEHQDVVFRELPNESDDRGQAGVGRNVHGVR